METKADTGSRLFAAMAVRPMIVIGAAVAITALLAIPFLTMKPTTSASQEPGGPVFDARDAVEEQFVSAVFTVPIIVEAVNDPPVINVIDSVTPANDMVIGPASNFDVIVVERVNKYGHR